MMKIGLLYICTGKYTLFWNDFYTSSKENFMPEDERHYFVFTDGNISTFDDPNVHVIYQNKLGWPFDTLKRFDMFYRAEDELSKMDYLFYFNANILVKKVIDHGILPDDTEELSVTISPGNYKDKDPDVFTYDRNPESHAYISFGEGKYYVQGGFNGGRSDKFLNMSKKLSELIEDDLSRGVIALWHDESHLNKYILDKNVKFLNPGYLYPEGWNIPFEEMMMTRNKRKYGGKNRLRGIDQNERFSSLFQLFRFKI